MRSIRVRITRNCGPRGHHVAFHDKQVFFANRSSDPNEYIGLIARYVVREDPQRFPGRTVDAHSNRNHALGPPPARHRMTEFLQPIATRLMTEFGLTRAVFRTCKHGPPGAWLFGMDHNDQLVLVRLGKRRPEDNICDICSSAFHEGHSKNWWSSPEEWLRNGWRYFTTSLSDLPEDSQLEVQQFQVRNATPSERDDSK